MDPQILVLGWVASIGGLVIYAVRLVFTGRLVPGQERDYWREAFFEEQRQKRQLLDAGKVTQDVLRVLPEVVREAEKP